MLRDAADAGILRQHGDVVEVVELREDAELREFGDACDEDKAKILIQLLQG